MPGQCPGRPPTEDGPAPNDDNAKAEKSSLIPGHTGHQDKSPMVSWPPASESHLLRSFPLRCGLKCGQHPGPQRSHCPGGVHGIRNPGVSPGEILSSGDTGRHLWTSVVITTGRGAPGIETGSENDLAPVCAWPGLKTLPVCPRSVRSGWWGAEPKLRSPGEPPDWAGFYPGLSVAPCASVIIHCTSVCFPEGQLQKS